MMRSQRPGPLLSPDLDDMVALHVLRGYRRLAIHVLAHAFRDLRRGSPELRLSALEFLTDPTRLDIWCNLAEVGAARITARALAQMSPVGGTLGSPAPRPTKTH
jgi:hypothetical protein